MDTYPKVKVVKPIQHKRLLVTFHNDIQKIYDCTALLGNEHFTALIDDGLFNSVKADQGGYGISWNDEIDLSEAELWIHGSPLEQVR